MTKKQLVQEIRDHAKEGKRNSIKRILDKNSTLKLDTNTFDDGFTALILAVRANKPNAVRYLCRIGADISLRCHLGTALEIAKENCNGEVVDILETSNSPLLSEENITLGLDSLSISETKEIQPDLKSILEVLIDEAKLRSCAVSDATGDFSATVWQLENGPHDQSDLAFIGMRVDDEGNNLWVTV
ncbi:MAG: ankyrin repeat domain-containing protein [Rickettsiales bacterium]|jgi:hypothetical protein|nr:ankyrin repeat domain-containing protein [Rickettsiales bacterium]